MKKNKTIQQEKIEVAVIKQKYLFTINNIKYYFFVLNALHIDGFTFEFIILHTN